MSNSEETKPKTGTDPQTGPPPRSTDTISSNKEQVTLLTDPQTGPPPASTDMFFSRSSQIKTNLIDTLRFGIAIGLAWAIMFVIISIIVWISGSSALGFFEIIYPGYISNAISGIAVGFAWSFVYGFIFGIIIAILYNSLVRKTIFESEGWETYG
jgi:tetrahydromethanopterin S-methyltransferase subunit F